MSTTTSDPHVARSSSLDGTGLLLRLAVRRDRVLVPVWLGVLVFMSALSAAASAGLYVSEAERVRVVTTMNDSPAIVALYGPILDPRSLGELSMAKMTVLYAIFVAALALVVVRRHTRVEEESGRTELVGGTSVGRDAPLAAAVLEAVGVSLVLGLLTAVGNTLGGLDPGGSLVFGAVWAGTGLVATGIAALSAQLSASARTCGAFAATAVGALYVLRVVGDTGPGWVSWLSPFGWNTQVSAYSEPRLWLLPCYPLTAAVLVAVAARLRAGRDLGSGLVAARPGPAVGSPRLADALSLAVKVNATTIVLWSAAAAVLGVLFGMIAPGIGDMMDAIDVAQDVIDRLGGFLVAALLSVIAVEISYFAVAVVGHAGRDEGDGRTELVLATATSRSRWFAATVVVAFGGTAWLLLVTGVSLWVGYAAAEGPGIGNLVEAALAWVPAVWVVAALAALGLAVRPTWTALGWAWPVGFLLLTLTAELLEWPSWVADLSPYAHVPAVPAEPWDWGATLGLSAVAGALVAAAWWRFRSRDIG